VKPKHKFRVKKCIHYRSNYSEVHTLKKTKGFGSKWRAGETETIQDRLELDEGGSVFQLSDREIHYNKFYLITVISITNLFSFFCVYGYLLLH
jgi:hypothetical protein